jgi:hypothetical protein
MIVPQESYSSMMSSLIGFWKILRGCSSLDLLEISPSITLSALGRGFSFENLNNKFSATFLSS